MLRSSVTTQTPTVTVMTTQINLDPVRFRNVFIYGNIQRETSDENKQHK